MSSSPGSSTQKRSPQAEIGSASTYKRLRSSNLPIVLDDYIQIADQYIRDLQIGKCNAPACMGYRFSKTTIPAGKPGFNLRRYWHKKVECGATAALTPREMVDAIEAWQRRNGYSKTGHENRAYGATWSNRPSASPQLSTSTSVDSRLNSESPLLIREGLSQINLGQRNNENDTNSRRQSEAVRRSAIPISMVLDQTAESNSPLHLPYQDSGSRHDTKSEPGSVRSTMFAVESHSSDQDLVTFDNARDSFLQAQKQTTTLFHIQLEKQRKLSVDLEIANRNLEEARKSLRVKDHIIEDLRTQVLALQESTTAVTKETDNQETYKAQAKTLAKDLEAKDRELQILKEELASSAKLVKELHEEKT